MSKEEERKFITFAELVEFVSKDEFLSKNCWNVTDKQKKILHQKIVLKMRWCEIAKYWKNSSTNVSYLYDKAVRNLSRYISTSIFSGDSPIQCIPFELRYHALVRYCESNGIRKLSDLNGHSYEDLCTQRNMGKRTVDGVQKILQSFGMSLNFTPKEKVKSVRFSKLKRLISEVSYTANNLSTEDLEKLKIHIIETFDLKMHTPSNSS